MHNAYSGNAHYPFLIIHCTLKYGLPVGQQRQSKIQNLKTQ